MVPVWSWSCLKSLSCWSHGNGKTEKCSNIMVAHQFKYFKKIINDICISSRVRNIFPLARLTDGHDTVCRIIKLVWNTNNACLIVSGLRQGGRRKTYCHWFLRNMVRNTYYFVLIDYFWDYHCNKYFSLSYIQWYNL